MIVDTVCLDSIINSFFGYLGFFWTSLIKFYSAVLDNEKLLNVPVVVNLIMVFTDGQGIYCLELATKDS